MFEIPHATIFVEFPPSNSGSFLLDGTTVLQSRNSKFESDPSYLTTGVFLVILYFVQIYYQG